MSGSYRAPGPPIRDAAPAAAEPLGSHEFVATDAVEEAAPDASPAWAPGALPPVAVAPTPAPPASAQHADPAEVTKTLASLADLRDRGAISPEEYESKKADLLGRL
jgi:hypothetical protein